MLDSSSLEMSDLFFVMRRVGQFGMIANEFLFGRVTKRAAVFLACVCVVSIICIRIGENYLWTVLIAAFCMRDLDPKSVLKGCLVVECILLALISFGGLMELFPKPPWIGLNSARARNPLGFEWYTYASHYVLNILLIYLFLARERFSYFALMFFAIASSWVFFVTDSRNSFFLCLIVLAVVFVQKIRGWKVKRRRILDFLLSYSFVLCAVISVVLLLFIPHESILGSALNKAFSNRLVQTQYTFNQYGPSLFGNEIEWVTSITILSGKTTATIYNYIDCSYLCILIECGVIVFLIVISMLTMLCRKAVKNGDYILAFILSMYAVHSILDPQLFMLNYCCFLLLLGKLCSADDHSWTSSCFSSPKGSEQSIFRVDDGAGRTFRALRDGWTISMK